MILSENYKIKKAAWLVAGRAGGKDGRFQTVRIQMESTNSIPDLNKIIRLAGLFNVSTDFLLKDDIDTTEYLNESADADTVQVSLEQALSYIDNKKAQAKLTAKGVAFLSARQLLCFSSWRCRI